MLENNMRENNSRSTETLEYPIVNLLSKVIGRLTILTGWCIISTEAVMEANPCAIVIASFGADRANECVEQTADYCCPGKRQETGYRPIEMDLLEEGYESQKLR